ncbi:MAG: peptidoglycan-binding protein [Chthoniobacterales bacterium]
MQTPRRNYQPPAPTATLNGNGTATVPTDTTATTTAARDWRNGGATRPGWQNRGDRTGNNTSVVNTPTTDPATREAIEQDRRNRTGSTGTEGSFGTAPGRRGGHRGFHDRHEGDPNFQQEHQRYHERHDRSWWRNRYNRFALFGGGYYYWNSGFWYPAYGYDSYYSTYAYDAPIYGYNDQEPGQVMADVQAELARRGYYYGAIDGTYGPQTRAALLRYQRENGLATTGMVDQPTLESLGYQ